MQYESLAPDLKAWLAQSIAQGFGREALEQSMRASGYANKFARRAVELALAKHGVPESAEADHTQTKEDESPTDPAMTNIPSTHELLCESPNVIVVDDHPIHILMALNAPRIILFGHFLTHEECDEMIRLSEPRLTRSTVVNSDTGTYDVHPARTSRGGHFSRGENELIRRIERRISETICVPVEHGEPIQILNYVPGAEYKAHFDYFDGTQPGSEKLMAVGGQRIATLVMYLNDVTSGGSTVFPEVGLDVLPKKGNAVYFAYGLPDGASDPRTLHGGSPVQEGEKWIATKWIRQRQYGA